MNRVLIFGSYPEDVYRSMRNSRFIFIHHLDAKDIEGILKNESFELIVLSIRMTGRDGIKILEIIKNFDPEIPVDIYELGLIYDVFVNEDYEVKILMTLTTPNCPVAETLPLEVEEKVKSINEVKTAEVEITFDPPWNQDLMSEEAKLELGML